MILHFEYPHPATNLIGILSDPIRFTKAHPLIEKMEPLEEGVFKVYETVKMGPFSFAFTYKATVDVNFEEGIVSIRISVKKLTHIDLIFKITPMAEGCSIEEHIYIRSVLPIHRYMNKLFEEQHAVLFANINRELHGEE